MFTRRGFFRSTLGFVCACQISALRRNTVYAAERCTDPDVKTCREEASLQGCEIPSGQEASLAAHADKPAAVKVPWKEKKLIEVSGVKGFDDSLRKNVLEPLSQIFGVSPAFGYYDEKLSDGRANAVASSQVRVSGTDGTVLVGLLLLEKMLKSQDGDYALMAVCAHEYGHIRQYASQIHTKILDEMPCFCFELHADFLAGFFLSFYKQKFTDSTFRQIGVAWQSWETGCTHGTSTQRVEAIQAGYRFGRSGKNRTHQQAIEAGLSYISKYKK